jgi:putative addiction module component (TIGR02574 family)
MLNVHMSLDGAILNQVLGLPPTDRAELARKLLLSLEPADWDADSEDAWAAEIQARLARADAGQPTLDWRASIDRIRASVKNEPGQ